MLSAKMRVCACGATETADLPFYDGKSICRECCKVRAVQSKTRVRLRNGNTKANLLERTRRRDPKHRAFYIVKDSRRGDALHARQNNLSRAYVQQLIDQPCFYCGDTEAKMTADRIDNSLGHLVGNVNPACVRCNYFRRDMPYEAWLRLTPELRKLREEGLFGSWNAAAKQTISMDTKQAAEPGPVATGCVP